MPFIDQQSEPQGLTLVDAVITATATGQLVLSPRSTVSAAITATAAGSAYITGESEADAAVSATVRGGLQGEPDTFGVSEIQATVTGEVRGSTVAVGNTEVSATVSATVRPTVSQAERFRVPIILDLLAPRPAGGRMYAERLTVDGQELRVIDWQMTWPRKGIEHQLSVTLLDPEDRNLITRDAEITFEVGWADAPFETFNWVTLLDTGYANSSGHQIVAPSQGPDRFTFIGLSNMQRRLNRTPPRDLVIYDPLLVDVDASDFRVIYDDFGRPFTTETIAVPNLTMERVFELVLRDRCGFAQVRTNLPVEDWRISRIDFEAGVAYALPIAQRIGMFNPSLDEQGSVLWVRGTGLPYPAGYPTPETIELSETVSIDVATNHRRVDVIEMVYNLWTYEYDYFNDRTDVAVTESANDGRRTITTVTTTVREFYRDSQPTVPVHEEVVKVHTLEQREDGWVMENSNETFFYNGTNRIARRKLTQVPVPDLGGDLEPIIQFVQAENENFFYKGHPFKPSQVYQWRRELAYSGLIAVDFDNPQLGRPFRQAVLDAYRGGNLNENTQILSGAIKDEDEIVTIITRDRVQIRSIFRDHLAEVTNRSFTEERVGDIGRSALVNDPREMFIFDEENAERTFDFKEEINIGELSPIEGIKLCRRELKRRKLLPKQVNDTIEGIDPSLKPGATRRLVARDGSQLGVFEIEGVTMNGSRQGYFTSFEGVQSA